MAGYLNARLYPFGQFLLNPCASWSVFQIWLLTPKFKPKMLHPLMSDCTPSITHLTPFSFISQYSYTCILSFWPATNALDPHPSPHNPTCAQISLRRQKYVSDMMSRGGYPGLASLMWRVDAASDINSGNFEDVALSYIIHPSSSVKDNLIRNVPEPR